METLDQLFHAGYGADKRHHHHHSSFLDNKDSQNFAVEDLLDFPKDDEQGGGGGGDSGAGCSPSNSSSVTVFDSGNAKSLSGVAAAVGVNPGGVEGGGAVGLGGGDGDRFSSDLCVPYDDLAELEWLSNFVDESFSSEDLQKMQLISGIKAQTDEGSTSTRELQPEQFRPHHNSISTNNNSSSTIFQSYVSVPAKARSKRPRAAPCNWATRLVLLSEPNDEVSPHEEPDGPFIPMSPQPNINKKNSRAGPKRKIAGSEGGTSGEGRRCLHCATDKTPQWRTGPMGPKTLCNACGVRYKSGRLVPEYRPASSPTFVLTKHSNSHRKVLELRRQKEHIRTQHIQHQPPYGLQGQNMSFDMPSNSEDYLIHHHIGPDFQHLI